MTFDHRKRIVVLLIGSIVAFLAHGAGKPPLDWPEFRGPSGDGHVPFRPNEEMDLPLHWSETENVKWKTEIPPQGWSTPVVMDGRIWLTTASLEGHDFFAIAVEAETGQIVFHEKLFHSDNPEPLGNDVNCYASPSPVIEKGRVYIHFGSYGTACLDSQTGTVLWRRADLPCRHFRGPGSSPILYGSMLVLTFDGADVQYVTALDTKTGKTIWKTDRTTPWPDLDADGKPVREGDFHKSFTTPIVVEAGGAPQLISPSSYAGYAYDVRTGQEIWKTHHPAYSPAVRPVQGNGLAYVATGRGNAELWAMRLDGHGDVTDTHVAWKVSGKIVPEEPSPILAGDLLYLISNDGLATCLDANSGEQIWSERLGGNYMASPIYDGSRLYFFSTQGKSVVLRAGRTFEILATNKLDAGMMASPAVAGKALFLRTKTHLYRIEK